MSAPAKLSRYDAYEAMTNRILELLANVFDISGVMDVLTGVVKDMQYVPHTKFYLLTTGRNPVLMLGSLGLPLTPAYRPIIRTELFRVEWTTF